MNSLFFIRLKIEELRIVLLMKRGAGKSSAGNTLLGRKSFHTAGSLQGVTQACSKITGTIHGHRISVVDTPGCTDLILTENKTTQEIAKCIDLSDLGPHVFLLVIPIGRFTKEEINTAQQILEVFGEEAGKYTMEKTIEEYLEGNHPDLKKILDLCEGRYHVLNNRDNENHMQVFTLLEKIKLMVKRNKGSSYTKAMYQKTADQVEEKWKREKMLKAMMGNEYRRQMRNSAVGSNDEAKVRNDLEYNSNMKTTVLERKEESVNTPYF
uniref:AIG1-type G domain-containing protein n=1 Tax=Astyanax mexicanus TaxID=7994 RepID=A0A8B9RHP4_ASTMX